MASAHAEATSQFSYFKYLMCIILYNSTSLQAQPYEPIR